MFQGSLHQQVVNLSARILDPLQRNIPVNKTQYFHFIQMAMFLGPGKDLSGTLVLSLRDPGRSHFNAVHMQLL